MLPGETSCGHAMVPINGVLCSASKDGETVSRNRRDYEPPAWVLREYGEFFGAPSEGAIKKLVYDKDCAGVWQAVDRHDTAGEKEIIVRFLLHEVETALSGPQVQEAIATEKRKRQGKRISDLAAALRNELISLNQNDVPPPEILKAYRKACAATLPAIPAYRAKGDYDDAAKTPIEPQLLGELALGPAGQRILDGVLLANSQSFLDEARKAVAGGFMGALMGDSPALMAIEKAGKSWAKTKSVVYHPNHPSADRTYFMRRITAFFESWFDTPLREATVAIVGCFFEGEISVSTVAHRAPSAKKLK